LPKRLKASKKKSVLETKAFRFIIDNLNVLKGNLTYNRFFINYRKRTLMYCLRLIVMSIYIPSTVNELHK